MALHAIPVGMFSDNYSFAADGQTIALLELSPLRDAGGFAVAGEPYRLSRKGSGDFLLEGVGLPVMCATKRGAKFQSQFDLEVNRRRYLVTRDAITGKSSSVFCDGLLMGKIHRVGFLTRKTAIELPVDWPVPVQIFVFWLVLLLWTWADQSPEEEDSIAAIGGWGWYPFDDKEG